MKKNFKPLGDRTAGLAAFRTVARLGSFSRAADALDVSPSAVSQAVRALEARLGARLLNRSQRAVSLTEAGRRFLDEIVPALERIDAATQALQDDGDGPSGLLRINLSRIAAEMLVLPRLGAFLAGYPRIGLELFTDDTLADVVHGGFDAGIRLGRHLHGDMFALPLDGGQRRRVAASPAYLARYGLPRRLEDLSRHDCLRFRFPGSGRLEPWLFAVNGVETSLEVQGRLIFADDVLMRSAARDGLGLVQKFEASLQADLASGALIEVLADHAATVPGFHIYYPAREHLPPKLRVFVDFLRESKPARR